MRIILVLVALWLAVVPQTAAAQTAENIHHFLQEGIAHYEAERYAEAILILGRTNQFIEKILRHNKDRTTRLAAGSSNYMLGASYLKLDRYQEAETHLQRALTIWEEILGPTHTRTANALHALAMLHQAQGRYGEAEPLYQRVLTFYTNELGPAHQRTAGVTKELAELYIEQGRYGDAERLYQQELAVREKSFGPEHVLTGLTLNDLGGLYQAQGRHDEAKAVLRRAQSIFKKLKK